MKRIWVSPEDCIANHTCWTPETLKRYTYEYGNGDEVLVESILKDPNVSIVDKMYIVDITDMLSDEDSHWLAVDYAGHALTKHTIAGKVSLNIKAEWIKGQISDAQLLEAEKDAWHEAKTYPKSKAAAFACKKDPKLALRGASAFAGGWYGEAVDPIEKQWQWERMLERLEDTDE